MRQRAKWLWILLMGLMATSLTGCHERHLASPVSYDSNQVDSIRKTIDGIDWSELE